MGERRVYKDGVYYGNESTLSMNLYNMITTELNNINPGLLAENSIPTDSLLIALRSVLHNLESTHSNLILIDAMIEIIRFVLETFEGSPNNLVHMLRFAITTSNIANYFIFFVDYRYGRMAGVPWASSSYFSRVQ